MGFSMPTLLCVFVAVFSAGLSFDCNLNLNHIVMVVCVILAEVGLVVRAMLVYECAYLCVGRWCVCVCARLSLSLSLSL